MKKSELIFNNIPFKNLECYNAQKTIENIVKFLRGEKLYFYDRWCKNGSHFRLSKTGFTASVMSIMSNANINFEFGNDAPKGEGQRGILSELNALIHVLQVSLFHLLRVN